jgi:hypothetical protein
MTYLLTGRFERQIYIVFVIICNIVLIILKQLNLLIIVKLLVGLLVKKLSSSYVTLATFVLATEIYQVRKFYNFFSVVNRK